MSEVQARAGSVGVERWSLPTVEGPSIHRRNRLSVGELEELERAAWEEAFAEGKEAGLAAARMDIETRRAELERQASRLNSILDLLAQPLKQLDSEMERQLVMLAFTLAKQLVRRELKADPSQVIGIVRDTVALLPIAARNVRVHLHPEDAGLLREKLAETTADRAWSIVEDPVQSRGGCRVTTENSQIDARLETRLGAALSSLLGDERNTEGREAQT
ncbi:MAG: flagellar assembly protein FliH [Steroidobacteraceae bacterium]